MSRILVPVDQTPLSEEVLPWAVLIAKATGDSIHLFSSCDDKNATETEEYLTRLAGTLTGVTVTTGMAKGHPADAICEAAESEDTRLIALTTSARSGLKRAFQGSVADEVARASSVPVLVDRSGGLPAGLSKLVVTLDGSEQAEKALGPARELAKAAGADLLILRVYNPMAEYTLTPMGPATDMGEISEKLFEAAEDYMKSIAQPGETWEVRSGRPLDVIIDFAQEKGCEIIVMASHGRGGIIRLAIGSTSDSVLRASDRPVLLVRDTSE